jgi:sulfur-carrier protein
MYCPPEGVLALPEPIDVAALVSMLDIPPEEVKLIFVNGKRADTDQVLAEGDRVGLFPPVGGG